METALANEARSVPVRDGKTAYELKWKRAPSGVLLPFGCELWTLVEPHLRDKFDERGRRSIFLGYAGEGAVRFLDFTEAAQGHYRVRTTRDYQAVRHVFPMKEVKRRPEDDPARFRMQLAPEEDDTELPFEEPTMAEEAAAAAEDEEPATYKDFSGRERCSLCKLLRTDLLKPAEQPISCRACLYDGPHGKGRAKPGCLRSRCQGHRRRKARDEEQERPGGFRRPLLIGKQPLVRPEQGAPHAEGADPPPETEDVPMEERPPEDVPPPAGGAEDAARSVSEANESGPASLCRHRPPAYENVGSVESGRLAVFANSSSETYGANMGKFWSKYARKVSSDSSFEVVSRSPGLTSKMPTSMPSFVGRHSSATPSRVRAL